MKNIKTLLTVVLCLTAIALSTISCRNRRHHHRHHHENIGNLLKTEKILLKTVTAYYNK